MTFKQILILLKLRWWLILGLFSLIVAGTTAVSLVMPKQYTASTAILLDVKTDPLVAQFMPNFTSPGYMATQAEIVRSERVAGRVVKMLGLADNPVAVEQWRDATAGRVTLENYFGELLLRGLKVEMVPSGSMLNVAYTGNDPKFAAAVTNAITKAYLDLTVELRVEPARASSTFMDNRLRTLRAEFQASQDRLSAFQQKKGIVISPERIDLEQQRLNSLETSLATAMAESATTSSQQRNAGSEDSVDVQQSAVVQGLKTQLSTGETRLREVSEQLGAKHPQRMQLEAQVSELRRQLQSEMRRVSGGTASANRIASQRVIELRTMIDQQKRTVLSLRGERDEAAVLLKDVETAQKAYETVAQNRTRVDNEVQSEQARAKVMSPAVEPLDHSKPNIPKNVALAVAIGLLLGLGAAIGWELLDRRVRSEEDMLVADGVPVIGVLSSKPLDARTRLLPSPVRRSPMNLPPQIAMDGGTP